MMVSKFAEALYTKQLEQRDGTLAELVDAELQEVRQVLEGLSTWIQSDGEAGTLTSHWCTVEDGCGAACQRARALMEKLEIRP